MIVFFSSDQTEEDESSTLPPYTEDIMARMIGLGNVQDSCGLLRRCCKVPSRRGSPGGLLPFSPDNYPIPQPDFSNLPPGLLPPGISIQQVPGNPEQAYIVNQGGYPGKHKKVFTLYPFMKKCIETFHISNFFLYFSLNFN